MQLSNRDHGTKVAVHDLFGNMPVRVRQRPMDDADLRTRKKDWAFLCQIVTGMILAQGRPVRLTMKASDKEHIYRVKTLSSAARNVGQNSIDIVGQDSFNTALIRSTLLQGASLDPTCWSSWIKTSARTSSITVRAVFSLEPAPSKQLQFLSIGSRFISALHGHNVLYDAINQQFLNSSFAVREEEPGKRAKDVWLTNKQLRGSGRGVDRWPMFFIRVDLNRQQIHSLDQSGEELEKNRTLGAIADILKTMIVGFLKEHHFRPRKRRDSTGGSSPKKLRSLTAPADHLLGSRQRKPGQRRKPDFFAQNMSREGSGQNSDALGDLSMEVEFPQAEMAGGSFESTELSTRSRIKTSSAFKLQTSSTANQSDGPRALPSRLASSCATSPSQASKTTAKFPKTDRFAESTGCEPNAAKAPVVGDGGAGADGIVRWRHPVTKELLLLNARTGCAIKPLSPTRPATVDDARLQAGAGRRTHDTKQRLVRTSSGLAQPIDGSWVSSFFENWENPVFQKSENSIPRVSTGNPEEDLGRRGSVAFDKSFQDSTLPLQSKLSKDSLRNATVISQVDSKFILVKTGPVAPNSSLEGPGCSLLVFVDQHAADERIKVEALLSELCASPSDESRATGSPLAHRSSVETTTLQRPIFFEVHARENGVFRRHAAHFAKWGIFYDLVSSHTGPSTIESQSVCRLVVVALPPVVAERCRTEPKVLIEMLRSEAWKLEEVNSRNNRSPQKSQSSQRDATASASWVQRINTCPQGLLDMVNSRSCRSAIMFNDDLSLQQCEELIRKLADCHFPFQCAHGRPTMVPLIDLGALDNIGNSDGGSSEGSGFQQAFEKWI